MGQLAQRPRAEPPAHTRLPPRDAGPVVDRELRHPRSGGAALDEQLGAEDGAAGPEVEVLEQAAAREPEPAFDVADGEVERRADEAVPQRGGGAPRPRALRHDAPAD